MRYGEKGLISQDYPEEQRIKGQGKGTGKPFISKLYSKNTDSAKNTEPEDQLAKCRLKAAARQTIKPDQEFTRWRF